MVREEIESAGDHLSGKKRRPATKPFMTPARVSRRFEPRCGSCAGNGRGVSAREYRPSGHRGRLSEFRDAFAIIGTFDDLKKKFEAEAGGAKLPLPSRRPCQDGLNPARGEGCGRGFECRRSGLKKASKRVKEWPLGRLDMKPSRAALKILIAAGARRAARAEGCGRRKNFHELRKRVKRSLVSHQAAGRFVGRTLWGHTRRA